MSLAFRLHDIDQSILPQFMICSNVCPVRGLKICSKRKISPASVWFTLILFNLNSTNSPCRSKGKFLLMENPASWLHYVKMLRGRSEVWRQSGTSYHLPLRPFACWILSEDVTIQWLGVLRTVNKMEHQLLPQSTSKQWFNHNINWHPKAPYFSLLPFYGSQLTMLRRLELLKNLFVCLFIERYE